MACVFKNQYTCRIDCLEKKKSHRRCRRRHIFHASTAITATAAFNKFFSSGSGGDMCFLIIHLSHRLPVEEKKVTAAATVATIKPFFQAINAINVF